MRRVRNANAYFDEDDYYDDYDDYDDYGDDYDEGYTAKPKISVQPSVKTQQSKPKKGKKGKQPNNDNVGKPASKNNTASSNSKSKNEATNAISTQDDYSQKLSHISQVPEQVQKQVNREPQVKCHGNSGVALELLVNKLNVKDGCGESSAPVETIESSKNFGVEDSSDLKTTVISNASGQFTTRGGNSLRSTSGESMELPSDIFEDLKPNLNVVVVGHVDAGKSTLMGHLLYKLHYVSQKTMHKYEKESREMGKSSFAFAWVMDEEEEERERGVTVDVGIKYFETDHRRITLLDAPGHQDFIPNMITGASQGDVAILVIPVNPGEFEKSFQRNGQTREHAILVRYCGIRRLVVAMNKMDMCAWSQERFEEVKAIMLEFLENGGYAKGDIEFVAVSGLLGENLVAPLGHELAPWYQGRTLVQAIDTMPPTARPTDKPLRMVIADTFRSITLGHIAVSGKIEAGVLREKQEVLLAPLGVRCRVKAIQRHIGNEIQVTTAAKAGETVDVGLSGNIEENMVMAGSIICDVKHSIPILQFFVAEIATLEGLQVPLLNGTRVTLHTQSIQVPATVYRLISIVKGQSVVQSTPRLIRKNQTAIVEIRTEHPICIEAYEDYRPLSRILLRQNGVTVAAGRRVQSETPTQQ